MERIIHLSNSRRRDAQVVFEARPAVSAVRAVLPSGEEPFGVRMIKTTTEIETRLAAYGSAAELAAALVDADPDVDMQTTGRELRRTHRLYVDARYRIVYHVNFFQVVRSATGEVRERRDLTKVAGNVNGMVPLRWTGRMVPRGEALRRYVFTHNYQLRHVDGATFDFLYDMARLLDRAGAMVLIGAGKGGNDPILLSRGGQPYRGFLEGRIEGEKYCLIFHLSDMELKALPADHDVDRASHDASSFGR